MMLRSLAVWCGILILASLNGGLRDLFLVPRLGDTLARAISTVLLCAVILLISWLTIGWIGPRSQRDALAIGILWLGLTLLFEFGAGHYLFHKTWATLLEDYNIRRGRIWVAVLVVTLMAPLWMARARGVGPVGRSSVTTAGD